MKSIIVIGGGFSGSMVTAQLIHKATQALKIVVIERGEEIGRGVAYGTNDLSHLLNVPAGKMSAFPEQPTHFLDWMNAHAEKTEAGDFVPRKIYGDYIQSILAEATALAQKKGIVLKFVKGEVLKAEKNKDKVNLSLNSGETISGDQVVLSLGHFRPLPSAGLQASLERLENYISFYWRSHTWKTIPQDAEVLIVGSGLSMVDAVLGLKSRGHQGNIIALSRRGFIPQSHQASPEWKLSSKVLESSGLRNFVKGLRKEVSLAGEKGANWRSVIDALRPHSQRLWSSWTTAEKMQFLRHLRPYWEIHRHRMAPNVGKQIQECLNNGSLKILSGRIQNVKQIGANIEVTTQNRQGERRSFSANYLINCMGTESDMRKVDSPLVVSLLEQKLAELDPLRLGLLCSRPFYTLGPLCKGELWETTAVPEIRVQAAALADRLLEPN